MAQTAPRPKWGAGSFSAWMRHGLKELRAVFYHDSPIGREAEMGMYGTATPHEVWNSKTQEKRPMQNHNPNQSAPAQEPSMVDARIQEVEQAQMEQQHQPQQEMQHERGE